MILYLDTSALVPLLISEPASEVCGALWEAADQLITVRLTHVEAAAALAMAVRLRRITAEQHAAACDELTALWEQLDVLEVDRQLMLDASRAASSHRLRGYDAVHFASAVAVGGEDLVAATGDAHLLDAWRVGDLTTADVSRPG